MVGITKNKSLEIQAKKILHHMSDSEAQVNGDSSLKSGPRDLGVILTCWLEKAESVIKRCYASVLSL